MGYLDGRIKSSLRNKGEKGGLGRIEKKCCMYILLDKEGNILEESPPDQKGGC